MIQRIQSVYLLLAIVFLSLMLFMPLAILFREGETYKLLFHGLYHYSLAANTRELISPVPVVTSLLIINLFLCSLILFLYKYRTLQIRFSVFAIIILISQSAYQYYMYFFIQNNINAQNSSLTLAFIFPLVASLLIYMAIKAIRKDDELVKSVDRLR